jgi:hypothetical protein
MPLVRCPACRAPTPSAAVRCVHCGALPPTCPDCQGTGHCPVCGSPDADQPALEGLVCDKCRGSKNCPGCEGRKRRWAG